jgi:integrase
MNRKARTPHRGAKIVHTEFRNLPVGAWIADPVTEHGTALEARKLACGTVRLYFRWKGVDGKRHRLAIGDWDGAGRTAADPKGRHSWTLDGARQEVARLTDRIRNGDRDLRAALAAEELRHRQELEAEQTRQRAAEEAAAAGALRSLGVLCNAYVDSLQARGAARWKDVENALRNGIERPYPALWARPAAELEPEDLLPPIGRLIEQGKRRSAGMLRSHLAAAYNAAIRARTDPAAPETLRSLRIRSNPAEPVATVKDAIRAKERHLLGPELVAYWRAVCALDDPHRSMLQAHLLLGGQRLEQLARLTVSDWDRRSMTVTLRDAKGRRSAPRRHVLPVLPPVAVAFQAMRRGAGPDDPFLWTVTHGKTGCTALVAGDWCERVCTTMLAAGEISERFTLGDIRRSVETFLQGCGVPVEVRAHVQSHGLSGVQQRHYAKHDFTEDKVQALRLIWALVDPDAEQADRTERERLAKLAAGSTVLQFRRA